MIGAQSRRLPLAHRVNTATTNRVAPALAGALAVGAPGGASLSMSNMIGITVTAISAITVPATTGVMIRRSSERRADKANWKREEAITSVASSPGPPSAKAVTHTAMKAPEVPMMSTWPAPMRPSRLACRMVVRPLTSSAANTAQIR